MNENQNQQNMNTQTIEQSIQNVAEQTPVVNSQPAPVEQPAEKKKPIALYIIIAIVVIALICGGIFLLPNNNKEEKPHENTQPKVDSIKIEENDEPVIEGLSLIPRHLCGGVFFPFDKKNITVKDLSDSNKINMVLSHNYDFISTDTDDDFRELALKEDEFKKYFEDTSFLNGIKEGKLDTADAGGYKILDPIKIEYKDNAFYLSKYATGCEGPGNAGGEIEYKTAYKTGDELKITVYYYYKDYDIKEEDGETEFTALYYRDSTKSKEAIDEDGYVEYTLLDTYDLYFDLSNDNFRFTKMDYNKNTK